MSFQISSKVLNFAGQGVWSSTSDFYYISFSTNQFYYFYYHMFCSSDSFYLLKHRNYIPHNATRLPTVPLMCYVSSGWHSLEELSSTEKIRANKIFSFQTCSLQTVANSSKITQGNVSDVVQLPLVLQNFISQMHRYALRPVDRLLFVIGVCLEMCEWSWLWTFANLLVEH